MFQIQQQSKPFNFKTSSAKLQGFYVCKRNPRLKAWGFVL